MVERFSNDFIETRRKALDRFLKKTANHPVLSFSPHLQVFLTEAVGFTLKLYTLCSQNNFNTIGGRYTYTENESTIQMDTPQRAVGCMLPKIGGLQVAVFKQSQSQYNRAFVNTMLLKQQA